MVGRAGFENRGFQIGVFQGIGPGLLVETCSRPAVVIPIPAENTFQGGVQVAFACIARALDYFGLKDSTASRSIHFYGYESRSVQILPVQAEHVKT